MKVNRLFSNLSFQLFVLFLVVYGSFLVYFEFYYSISISTIQLGMLISISFVLLGTFAYSYKVKNWNVFLWGILISGILLRIGYALYTPSNVRGHDIGDFMENGYGHAGYIYRIYSNWTLPDGYYDQFYHPPLFHFLAACLIHITEFIMPNLDSFLYFEISMAISCFSSCAIVLVSKKMVSLFDFKSSQMIIFLLVISFFPNYVLMGGRINNDALVNLFIFGIIYNTFKWFKSNSLTDIIILALCFGFGLMSKMSCAIMAFFTAPFMLVRLYQAFKLKQLLPMIKSLMVFGVIAFAIGMYFPIHNYIVFDQPFGYVMNIGEQNPLYIGNISLWSRFSPTELIHLFDEIFAHAVGDYNVWNYLVKSACFGEFQFEIKNYWLLETMKGLMGILLMFGILCLVRTYKKRDFYWNGFTLLFMLQISSYLWFNVQYPYGCTMDFRYVIPIIPCIAYYLARELSVFSFWNTLLIGIVGLVSVNSILIFVSIT